MRNRGRGRRAGRLVIGVGGDGADGPEHDIVTVTETEMGSGIAIVTTAAPHGLNPAVTHSLVTSGISEAAYNGAQTVDTFGSEFQFVLSSSPYVGDATGGRWDFA